MPSSGLAMISSYLQGDMFMYFLKHNITANRGQNTLFCVVLCGQPFGTKRPIILTNGSIPRTGDNAELYNETEASENPLSQRVHREESHMLYRASPFSRFARW